MFFLFGFLTASLLAGLIWSAFNLKIYKGLTFSQMIMVPSDAFRALRRDVTNWFSNVAQKTREGAAQIIQFPKRTEAATSEA